MKVPTPTAASKVAADVLGERITTVERFTTGAGNWVYAVTGEGSTRAVVRFMRSDSECRSAVYWSNTLRPMGVPLPPLLAHHFVFDDEADSLDVPWLMLDRFDGIDLEHAYRGLTDSQKLGVLDRVINAQNIVRSLPRGRGFGYVNMPEETPHVSWYRVIAENLRQSRRRIFEVGVVDPGVVARVEGLLPDFDEYFASIGPVPFLDDTTTRNVLVRDGLFEGIVDVDGICYGDPLLVPSLTRMALLNLGGDMFYADAWLDRLGASKRQRRAVQLYTAVFCVNFLSEQGQQFNRDAAPPVDPTDVARLLQILDALLQDL